MREVTGTSERPMSEPRGIYSPLAVDEPVPPVLTPDLLDPVPPLVPPVFPAPPLLPPPEFFGRGEPPPFPLLPPDDPPLVPVRQHTIPLEVQGSTSEDPVPSALQSSLVIHAPASFVVRVQGDPIRRVSEGMVPFSIAVRTFCGTASVGQQRKDPPLQTPENIISELHGS
jgi:hypothetical protein